MEILNGSESIEKKQLVRAETSFEFEENGLKGKWLKLSAPDGKSVEGAHYEPEQSNGDVIIFHPGLPGDMVKKFEEDFVPALLAQGYAVFSARHNGLKDQEGNDSLFHNQTRVDQHKDISGDAFGWFTEPQVSMAYFAQQQKPITLITHSFSGITAANSFVEMAKADGDSNPAHNVRKWILLSGSVWEKGENDVLDPDRGLTTEDMRQYCRYFETKYAVPGKDKASRLLTKIESTLDRINSEISDSIPKTVEIIGVYPTSDKLVSPKIGTAFIDKLPRGIVLRDNHVPSHEAENPHEFTHAKPIDLLRIIRMKTSQSKHIFDINK